MTVATMLPPPSFKQLKHRHRANARSFGIYTLRFQACEHCEGVTTRPMRCLGCNGAGGDHVIDQRLGPGTRTMRPTLQTSYGAIELHAGPVAIARKQDVKRANPSRLAFDSVEAALRALATIADFDSEYLQRLFPIRKEVAK